MRSILIEPSLGSSVRWRTTRAGVRALTSHGAVWAKLPSPGRASIEHIGSELPTGASRLWSGTVRRHEIRELHYITSIRNVRSIAQHGIRCHNRMIGMNHVSVANSEVQEIRARKTIAGNAKLHDYANLYFDARNPMMYVLRQVDRRDDLIVVRVSPTVLDAVGTVVTDGNAATVTTRFYDPRYQLTMLDRERICALSWNDPDPFVKAEKKRQRCAEVLVPDEVAPSLLIGCYVERIEHLPMCRKELPGLRVEVNTHVFFC